MKQALILNDDRTQLAAQTCELIRNGFYVINAASLTDGLEYARLGQIDLVVMCERINSQLTHTVALTAEQKNPDVVTILITDRNDSDIDEVFDLLPSLTTLIGTEISMFTFSKILGCEKVHYAQNYSGATPADKAWTHVPMGAAAMVGSLRANTAPSSQIAQYNGPWPQSPFDIANLERGLTAGTVQPALNSAA